MGAAGKWGSLAILCIAEVMAMSLWFSTAAVLPALRREFALDDTSAALLTSAVSVGFVAGTASIALLGLADRVDGRRIFAAAALLGAAANAGLLVISPASAAAPLLRLAVGASAAGIYPIGMRLASTWARADMGLMIGLLVGAQVLGLSSPHLIDALGGLDWRVTLAAASALAVAGAALIGLMGVGPNHVRTARFQARYVLEAWRRKALRLANLGYFGHMWELFAMWGWIGLFLDASFRLNPAGPDAPVLAKLLAFAAVAAGGIGCALGGYLADRIGRTAFTVAAMATSGACCLLAGRLFGASPWLLGPVCLVWGAAVVADSPQFSASVIELAEPGLAGTMLMVQTCVGFLLTTVTIHLVLPLVERLGWSSAFSALALGPAFGIWAMLRLRGHPDARHLAGGLR